MIFEGKKILEFIKTNNLISIEFTTEASYDEIVITLKNKHKGQKLRITNEAFEYMGNDYTDKQIGKSIKNIQEES